MADPNPDAGLNWLQRLLRPLIREAVADAVGDIFGELRTEVAAISTAIDTLPNNIGAAVQGVVREGAVDAAQLASAVTGALDPKFAGLGTSLSGLAQLFNPATMAQQIAQSLPNIIPHIFGHTPPPYPPPPPPAGGVGDGGIAP